MKKNYLHAYAIVRYDSFQDESVSIEERITVKKVVFDPDEADAEVRRLNDLNRDKGVYYFSQVTRIEQPFAAKHDPAAAAVVEEAPQLDEAATTG